jgi:hypothetical protein
VRAVREKSNLTADLRETRAISRVCASGQASLGECLMRTSAFAITFVLTAITSLPCAAQQQSGTDRQMEEEADKGVKTRQSGESGYVGDQEKAGSSAHPPGRSSDTSPSGSAGSMPSTSPSTTGEKSR